jgi:hypothetical protein
MKRGRWGGIGWGWRRREGREREVGRIGVLMLRVRKSEVDRAAKSAPKQTARDFLLEPFGTKDSQSMEIGKLQDLSWLSIAILFSCFFCR